MDNQIPYYGKILIIQDSFANETVRYANGYFSLIDGEVAIELNEQSPFRLFQFSQSRFIAQVEIKEPNQYCIFDLALNPVEPRLKGLEITQFKVEMNNNFKLFKSFVEKQELEKELVNNGTRLSIKKI